MTYHWACKKNNTTGATCGAGTAYTSGVFSFLVFSLVRVAQSLVVCVLFCRSLFFLVSVFFWPWRCLSFFDLQILLTPLVSLNSSEPVSSRHKNCLYSNEPKSHSKC